MAQHPKQLPVPQAQAFVICREIWENPRTREFLLAGPVSHIPIPKFPAEVQFSVYVHITGGHGMYAMEFLLRTADGDPAWRWRPDAPLEHPNPAVPQQLAFHELRVVVPAAGRYDFALMVDSEEIARQPLLIGPGQVFKRDH